MRTKQNHAHKGLADSGHEGNIPKSRSERRREDARRRLMKAAYEIIAQRGLEGLIVQDVTETADVGYGSFYNHFSSKEAIVEAVNHAVSTPEGFCSGWPE
jgi:DNA-binding transcriptional regulator YbjK